MTARNSHTLELRNCLPSPHRIFYQVFLVAVATEVFEWPPLCKNKRIMWIWVISFNWLTRNLSLAICCFALFIRSVLMMQGLVACLLNKVWNIAGSSKAVPTYLADLFQNQDPDLENQCSRRLCLSFCGQAVLDVSRLSKGDMQEGRIYSVCPEF